MPGAHASIALSVTALERRDPRHAERHQRDDERAVPRARALRARHGGRELARPEGADRGERRHAVTGRLQRAEQQGDDRRLVGDRQHQPVRQPAQRRQRPPRDPVRPHAGGRRTPPPARPRPAPSAVSAMLTGRVDAAQPTNATRPTAPISRSRATSAAADATGIPVPFSRRTRHASAPMCPGVSRPSSSDSAYFAQVPAPRAAALGDRVPAQRAQDVLADHPRHEAGDDRPRRELRQPRDRQDGDHDRDRHRHRDHGDRACTAGARRRHSPNPAQAPHGHPSLHAPEQRNRRRVRMGTRTNVCRLTGE